MSPLGERNQKLAPGFFWTLPHVSISSADFNISFHCNNEYNSVSQFCESF